MFGFGKSSSEKAVEAARRDDNGPMDQLATNLVERLLVFGFNGKAGFDSAAEVADAALKKHGGDRDRAIAQIVADHRKLAATEGFVTGLGGLLTMPVALPANVVGFYLVATRMVAAVARVRGHDIDRQELRSAVLLTLVGTEANDLLQKAGVVTTGRLAGLAAQKLPPAALMVVNKAVGFRLLGQVGTKLLPKLGKSIPLVGGVVGAGLDVMLLNRIADKAKQEFGPVD